MKTQQWSFKKWLGEQTTETYILCIFGVCAALFAGQLHYWVDELEWGIILETLILVFFLAGVMGITRIPLPIVRKNQNYAWMFGFTSAFMDSFLVLLLLKRAKITGSPRDIIKFKVCLTHAALIGGLLTYFGEVYFIPKALQHEGMKTGLSMLPMAPPILFYLWWLSRKVAQFDIKIETKLGDYEGAVGAQPGHFHKKEADIFDYLEFAAAIALLLVTKNPLMCLGIYCVWSFITAQGKDLVEVTKSDAEMGVLMLLATSAIIIGPLQPYIMAFAGWKALILSSLNAVVASAIYPGGDVWQGAIILSVGALIHPASSLVGVMVFPMQEWGTFVKESLKLGTIWFVVASLWIFVCFKPVENWFYDISGMQKPILKESIRERLEEHHIKN